MNKCIHIKFIWKVLKSFITFTVISFNITKKCTFRFSLKDKSHWWEAVFDSWTNYYYYYYWSYLFNELVELFHNTWLNGFQNFFFSLLYVKYTESIPLYFKLVYTYINLIYACTVLWYRSRYHTFALIITILALFRLIASPIYLF